MNLESDMSELYRNNTTQLGPSSASDKKMLQRLRDVAEMIKGLSFPDPGYYLVYRRQDERQVTRLLKITRVGRSPEVEVSINDPWLSHTHFICMITDEGIIVSDPDSRNGTFVNGELIKHQRVVPGDIIRAGDLLFAVVEEPE